MGIDSKALERVKAKVKNQSQAKPKTRKGPSKFNDPWNIIINKCHIRKEAVRHNPLYRTEFDEAFTSYREKLPTTKASESYLDLIGLFQLSDEGEKLCERWGLDCVLHPDDDLWNLFPADAPCFFKDPGRSVKVTPHEKTRVIQISDHEDYLDFNSHLREDRYLILEIDLSANNGQIEDEISEIVNRYQNLIINNQVKELARKDPEGPPIPPEDLPPEQWISERERLREIWLTKLRKQVEKNMAYKRRGPSLDINFTEIPPSGPVTIFEIWKMKNELNIGAWRIVKKLFASIIGKSPFDYSNNYDQEAKRLKKAVEDAIKKADELIKSVTPAY